MTTTTESWSRWIAGAVIAAAVTFCGRSVDPGSSESHFLETCSGVCPGSLSCLCGVCTLPCTSDGDCTSVAAGATCTTTGAADGANCASELDAGAARTCAVSCRTQTDCAALGTGVECVTNHCRRTAQSGASGESGGGGGPSRSPGGGGSAGSATSPLPDCSAVWPGFAIHYPSEPGSPCPPANPSPGESCDLALDGIACIYSYTAGSNQLTASLCNAPNAPGVWTPSSTACSEVCAIDATASWTSITSDCATRTAFACPLGDAGAPDPRLLVQAIYNGCGLAESRIVIIFSGGCATALSATAPNPSMIACVAERLSRERYDCTSSSPCVAWEESTLR